MYSLVKPLLFALDPERAHAFSMAMLAYIPNCCFAAPASHPVSALGLNFAHRIGLAAGFDKSGSHLDVLSKLGFAFIEVGTVTPKPQLGNPKPRLFRLPEAQALINRMGFNNPGVDVLSENLNRSHYQGVLGINIGKGKDTSLAAAAEDYVYCLQRVYTRASYVAINISSPNTPDLRALQQPNYFSLLVRKLKEAQLRLADKHGQYVPLLIKISPDETDDTLKQMTDVMLQHAIDGAIVSNTTCSRDAVPTLPNRNEMGGLSGQPLLSRSTQCLALLKQAGGDQLTLMGVGGIDSLETAQQKLIAGATLLQVYTGLIYRGPGGVATLSHASL